MEIKKRHVYYFLALTFLAMLAVAIAWEFVLEDMVVPMFFTGYETESVFERWEYVVTSLTFYTAALAIPAWLAVHGVARSEQATDALKQERQGLAEHVERRTAELRKANRQLQSALDEQQRIEEALRKSEKELRHLSSRLLTAQENERRRVARELHDGISQSLSALKFRVEHILDRIANGGIDGHQGLNELLIPLIQDAIEDVRKMYMGLRPSILDDLGIIATINWFCREFQNVYPEIRVQHTMDIEESEIPEALKIIIFRVLQEGLSNVARHSQADHVSVALLTTKGGVEFAIQDNGIGFQLDEVDSLAHDDGGMGLSSMRERVEFSGGWFEIQTARGAGTLLRTAYPLARERHA